MNTKNITTLAKRIIGNKKHFREELKYLHIKDKTLVCTDTIILVQLDYYKDINLKDGLYYISKYNLDLTNKDMNRYPDFRKVMLQEPYINKHTIDKNNVDEVLLDCMIQNNNIKFNIFKSHSKIKALNDFIKKEKYKLEYFGTEKKQKSIILKYRNTESDLRILFLNEYID